MKQSKRLLAFLMAVVLLMSTLAVGGSARAALPTTYTSAQYDFTGKILLTTEQYATIILDELDAMLAEGGTILDIGGLLADAGLPIGAGLKLELTGIDTLFKSLNTLWTSLSGTVAGLIPAFKGPDGKNDLNLSYITGDSCRRNNGNDVYVLQCIFDVLADPNNPSGKKNAEVLGSLVGNVLSGNLEASLGGTVAGLLTGLLPAEFDLSDVKGLLKGLLWEMTVSESDYATDGMTDAEKDAAKAAYIANNKPSTYGPLDSMVVNLLFSLLGDLEIKIDEETSIAILPLIEDINFETDSVYDLLDTVLPLAYDKVIQPLLEKEVPTLLADLQKDSPDIAEILNMEFDIPTWADLDVGTTTGTTLLQKLNHIVGIVVNRVVNLELVNAQLPSSLVWVEEGGNAALISNIITFGKAVLSLFGEKIFPGLKLPTAEEMDAMQDEAFVAFFARTLLNSLLDFVIIPDTADSIGAVLNTVLIELAADKYPLMYGGPTGFTNSDGTPETFATPTVTLSATTGGGYVAKYYGADKKEALADFETTKELLSDLLTNQLFFNLDTNVLSGYDYSSSGDEKKAVATEKGVNSLRYADTFDMVVAKLLNWVVGNYGGVVDGKKIVSSGSLNPDNAWQTLDNIIFSLIDSTWLAGNYGAGAGQKGIKELLFEDIIKGVFDLNVDGILKILDKTSGSLNNPVVRVLLNLILRVLDLINDDIVTDQMFNDYTTLENLLFGNSGGVSTVALLLQNLLEGLGKAGARLIGTALPLVSELLGITKMQGYTAPTFELDPVINGKVATVEFDVLNETDGLPVVNYGNLESTLMGDVTYSYKLTAAKAAFIKTGGEYESYANSIRLYANGTPLPMSVGGSGGTPADIPPGEKATVSFDMGDLTKNDGLWVLTITYNILNGTEVIIPNIATRIYSFSSNSAFRDDGTPSAESDYSQMPAQ
ncbi:MAG: hypothetical protein LBB67_00185, partial [Oscillospiraceae bacterium]|nr:hypothetical protein [Oscillospiraceae bacterium]